jgi:hypothetical protein
MALSLAFSPDLLFIIPRPEGFGSTGKWSQSEGISFFTLVALKVIAPIVVEFCAGPSYNI